MEVALKLLQIIYTHLNSLRAMTIRNISNYMLLATCSWNTFLGRAGNKIYANIFPV